MGKISIKVQLTPPVPTQFHVGASLNFTKLIFILPIFSSCMNLQIQYLPLYWRKMDPVSSF